MQQRLRSGASLVEILVVIVVFTVGILAVVQIFPTGLGVLRTSKQNTVAVNLVRSEIDRLKGSGGQVPEMIAPVSYRSLPGGVQVVVDPNRTFNDLMPPEGEILIPAGTDDPHLYYGGEPHATWQAMSGANIFSRVIGEGRPVPAPSVVNGEFASVLTLQFAPILEPYGTPLLSVYGNDLFRIDRQPSLRRGARPYLFYFVRSDRAEDYFPGEDQLWLGPIGAYGGYRVEFGFSYDLGGAVEQYDTIVNLDLNQPNPAVQVATDENGTPRYYVVSLNQLVSADDVYGNASPYAPGAYLGAISETVSVQPLYERIANNAAFNPSRPLQYKLNPPFGDIKINPAATDLEFLGIGGRREPIEVVADYTVMDWRIIRDEFRVPASFPHNRKLALESLKVAGEADADSTSFEGIGIATLGTQAAGGELSNQDFVLQDLDTGAEIIGDFPGNEFNSYTVDKSLGVLEFVDADGDASNGLSAYIRYQVDDGFTDPIFVPDLSGRAVRAYYMAKNEWAVQPVKAADDYRLTGFLTAASGLQPGEAYLGGFGSSGLGQPYNIYFPQSDVGQKVTVGEVWFNVGGAPQLLRDQEFQIQPCQDLPLGCADIRGKAGAGAVLDASNGYVVRDIRGASLGVRALWNPGFFSLSGDGQENWRRFSDWARNWRRTESETFYIGGLN